jgi:hypothetical protein
MVKNRRAILALVLLILVGVAVVMWQQPDSPTSVASAPAASPGAADEIPWLHLDRLKSPRTVLPLGRRDIFHYGPEPTPPPTPVPEATEMVAIPPSLEPQTGSVPTPAMTTPLTLKFMGVAQPDGGKKIALLLTEQKETLIGHEGDILAGRYRIVKIGLESVDIEEVTTGQKQTIRIGGR